MNEPKRIRVVDERGTAYVLAESLGEGGQGAVYRVEGGRVAVKLYRPADNAVTRDKLRSRLRRVRHYPLEGLPIAKPLVMLRAPAVGYVMERLTGMVPLAKLTAPQGDDIARWYLETGGLRRRLRLLASMADTLNALHSRGLVFGDLSPNNVFISGDADAHEIRFIDADNLCYESQPELGNVYYTPFYGAPEVVSGDSGVNTLSDAHAFAVMVFETLSLVHPLIGDMVTDGDPELEDEALLGKLPWVDDPDDDSNSSSTGLPREMVLSPGLRALAQAAFGPGLRHPEARPGLAPWAERLWSAFDATLRCPDCGSTYYPNETQCPWCDYPRPAFVLFQFSLWEAQRKRFVPFTGLNSTRNETDTEASWRRPPPPLLAVDESEQRVLARRHVVASGAKGALPVFTVDLSDRRLTLLVNNEDAPSGWFLVSPEGKRVDGKGERVVVDVGDRAGNWDIHFGPVEVDHRVATVRFEPG